MSFFESRQITYSFIRYCSDDSLPSSGSLSNNSVTKFSDVIEALLQSLVAWIRLPLLPSGEPPEMKGRNSLAYYSTRPEPQSNFIMYAFAEEFKRRAALHGCKSFVLVDFTLENDTSTHLIEPVPLSSEMEESYQWLGDDVTSF